MKQKRTINGCFFLGFFVLCGTALWWSETRLVEYPADAAPVVVPRLPVPGKRLFPKPPAQLEQGMITATQSYGAGHEDSSFGSIPWSSYGSGPDLGFSTTTLSTYYNVRDNFSFNIPLTATVVGIEPWLERFAINGGAVRTARIRIVKGGTIGSTELKTTTTEWAQNSDAETVGGASDLCGESWTPADINATSFGVALSAGPGISSGGDCIFQNCSITVYYSMPDGPVGGSSNPGFNWWRYMNPRTRLPELIWPWPHKQPCVIAVTRMAPCVLNHTP